MDDNGDRGKTGTALHRQMQFHIYPKQLLEPLVDPQERGDRAFGLNHPHLVIPRLCGDGGAHDVVQVVGVGHDAVLDARYEIGFCAVGLPMRQSGASPKGTRSWCPTRRGN